MPGKPVKIGIMSFVHLHAMEYASALKSLENVDFVGIADDEPARARKMARTFGVKAFETYEDLLESDVDGIVVTSENANHRRHVAYAAQHEKHILCEKPLATTLEDAEAIVEVCRRSRVQLMTAFPCRFHPAFKRLQNAVQSGGLGRLLAIKGTNQGTYPGGWFGDAGLSGGGAVIDHTVHLADLMRHLTGAEAATVYAETGNRILGMDVEDTGIVTVEFTNGTIASIDCSWSRPRKSYPTWGNLNMDVTGSDGFARMVMFGQKIDFYSEKAGKLVYEYWGDNVGLALVESFARCIAEDVPVPVDGNDGLKATQIALAAYKSAKSGEVVNLME